jgi:hypothetical protein
MTIPADLALGAGDRFVEVCIGLAVPGRPIRSFSSTVMWQDRGAQST